MATPISTPTYHPAHAPAELSAHSKAAVDALAASPIFGKNIEGVAAAAFVCDRAGASDPIDWAKARAAGSGWEDELSSQVERLTRLLGARFCSQGWSPMLSRYFSDMGEALAASRDPAAAWEWSDVKSKWWSLRAYGQPAARSKADFELALHDLPGHPGRLGWGDVVTGEALVELRRRLALSPQGLSISEGEVWGRPLRQGPVAQEREDEVEDSCAREQCELLTSAAERLSCHLCEGCGGPRPLSGASCELCMALKKRESVGEPAGLSHPIVLPKAVMALAALSQLIQGADYDRRKAGGAGSALEEPAPIEWTMAAAEELLPLARIALAGFDPNADLGCGVGAGLYCSFSPEMSLWLHDAGVDWDMQSPLRASAGASLRERRPDAMAALERRDIEGSTPGSTAARAPRRV